MPYANLEQKKEYDKKRFITREQKDAKNLGRKQYRDSLSEEDRKSYYENQNNHKLTDERKSRRKNASTKRKYNRKAQAIEYLGGRCAMCGLHDNRIAVYEFHHRDPSTKLFNIAHRLGYGWDKIKNELDKCDLLCAICHRVVECKYDAVLPDPAHPWSIAYRGGEYYGL